jgi:pimeloyl-ACP methyl ester carboxylesterase
MHPSVLADRSDSREGYAAVRDGRLFYREIGQGRPMIVLHGGPDFDHRYLLPELDRLSDSLRLIYYDQRGRGRSAPNVEPEAVTIESEIVPLVCAEHIAHAIPGARLVVLSECGHFAYLERPDEFRRAVLELLRLGRP